MRRLTPAACRRDSGGCMMIIRLGLAAAMVASVCLVSPAQADEAAKSKAAPEKKAEKTLPLKEASPFDNFNVKSTDTGDQVKSRLKIDLGKDNNFYLYGDRATIYPSGRKPGEDYQPNIPQATSKDSFGLGIGFGKKF
jgi:hypothetical protein